MAQVLVQDNTGKTFLVDTVSRTRQQVSGDLEAAQEQFGPVLTSQAQLPEAFRTQLQQNLAREFGSRVVNQLGDQISLDVRAGIGVGSPLEFAARETEEEGPSFFEQAKLLFPFVPDQLLSVFADSWERFGSRKLALQAMRQDPRYDQIFPGNKREDGSLRLSEAEYMSTIEGYRRRLGQFGVPVDTVLGPDQLRSLIEGEVSPREFGQRLDVTFTQVLSNVEPVREAFARFQGVNLSDAAIFASAINPELSPVEFEREIEQAQIAGEAAFRGFEVGIGEATRLETLGLDQQGARELFGRAQIELPRLNQLVNRFNDPDDEVTLEEFADAIVINDPDQLQQFGRLFGQATSSFSRRGRAREDRSGALRGLRQR